MSTDFPGQPRGRGDTITLDSKVVTVTTAELETAGDTLARFAKLTLATDYDWHIVMAMRSILANAVADAKFKAQQ